MGCAGCMRLRMRWRIWGNDGRRLPLMLYLGVRFALGLGASLLALARVAGRAAG